MTLDEEIRRGDQAKALMEHPLLVEAFDKIEQEALHLWQNTEAKDTESRETLYLSLKILHKLKAQIQEVVTTGELAKRQTAIEKMKAQAAKIFRVG